MAVYDDDIATAQELIAEFGQECFWQQPAPEVVGVPGYPTAGVLPDPIPCIIAFFSAKDLDRGTMQSLEPMVGTEVPDNMQVGLLAGGLSFEPALTDSIRRGAVDAPLVSIAKIDRLAPNGTAVLYHITVAA